MEWNNRNSKLLLFRLMYFFPPYILLCLLYAFIFLFNSSHEFEFDPEQSVGWNLVCRSCFSESSEYCKCNCTKIHSLKNVKLLPEWSSPAYSMIYSVLIQVVQIWAFAFQSVLLHSSLYLVFLFLKQLDFFSVQYFYE